MRDIKFIIIPFAILLLATPVMAKENDDIKIELWTLKKLWNRNYHELK